MAGPLAGLISILLITPSAFGIIDPNFTPKELVEQSDVIYVGTLAAAGKDWALNISRTMKGKEAKRHTITLAKCKADSVEDVQRLLKTNGQRPVILFAGTLNNEQAAYAQIGGTWVQLEQAGAGRWALLDYSRTLGATYAGGTDMLIRMCEYLLKDPHPTVPVSASVRWADAPTKVGTVNGKTAGIEAIELGAKRKLHLFVSSDKGDRLFLPKTEDFETAFSDVTAAAGLGAKSKRFLWLDVNLDGLADLVSWDGSALSTHLATRDGKLKPGAGAWSAKLGSGCTGLAACPVGRRQGLLVSSDGAPSLLVAEDGGWKARPLPGADDAANAAGGPCIVTDADADGRVDVLLPGAGWGLLWRGTADGFTKPVRSAVATGGGPARAALGDFNADGTMDILLAGGRKNSLWENDGKGGFKNVFRRSGSMSYKCPTNASGVAAMDLNHDGRQDLCFIYPGGSIMYHFNRGYRCFGEEGEVKLPGTEREIGRPPVGLVAMTAGDFDEAQSEDLVIMLDSGEVLVYMNDLMDMPAVRLRLPRGAAGPVTATVWQGDDFPSCMGAVNVRGHSPGATVALRSAGPATIKWAVPGRGVQKRTVEVENTTLDVILSAK